MHRRTLLAAFPAFAAAPAAGQIAGLTDDRDQIDAIAPLRIGGRRVETVVLGTPDGTFTAAVGQGAVRFFEDRVGTGGFFGLSRPTIPERLRAARPIGAVTLAGRTLIATTQAARFPQSRYFAVVAHDGLSWDVPHLVRRAAPAPAARRADGTLFLQADGRLLMTLPPV